MKHLFTSLLVIVLVLNGNTLYAQVLPSDSLALVSIYNSTGGSSWTRNDNWLSGPVPTWFGVAVSGNRVVKLELCTSCYNTTSGNNMVGSIPSSIGDLTELTNIVMSGNQFSGSIPTAIGNLAKVTWLDFAASNLSGVIPITIGNMTSLQTLFLGGNNLAGEIPEEVGNLSQLLDLSLSNNQLSGELPAELFSLAALRQLNLNNNAFTGSIPAIIGNLTNLWILSLEWNQFTGPIPTEIGNLGQLGSIYLHGNDFTGSIPPTIGNLTNLHTLFIYSNRLGGSIPKEIGQLTLLNTMYAYDNMLSGEMPIEMGNLTNLTSLSLYRNQLTGEIPSSLGNLTRLQSLALSDNQLTGSIPSTLGSLTGLDSFDVSNNQLSGEIPTSLSNYTLARYIVLNDNKFTGALPAGFSNLTNLEYLSLESNELTGLPDLSADVKLWHLTLMNNHFSFEDLEPNMDISGINYLPQTLTLPGYTRALTEGDLFNATFAIGGASNQYQWWKNGLVVPGATSSMLQINPVSMSDAGSYTLVITNTAVLGLYFETDPIVLYVSTIPFPKMSVWSDSVQIFGDDHINFDSISSGSTSTRKMIIGNIGNADLLISSIHTPEGFLIVDAPMLVTAGHSSQFVLEFSPLKGDSYKGVMVINSNAGVFEVQLYGSSYDLKPLLYVKENGAVLLSGARSEFPLTVLGSGTEKQLEITNAGNGPLTILSMNTTGDFISTSVFPATIQAGASTVVDLRFFPTQGGERKGTFELLTNSDTTPYSLELTGIGFAERRTYDVVVNQVDAFTGSNLFFERTKVGEEQLKTLSLVNTGNTVILIESIDVSGPFILVSRQVDSIAVGRTLELTLAFDPDHIGNHSGTIRIVTNGEMPEMTFNLVGEGEAEIEVFNMVTTRANGKNDFFNIRNIEFFPENQVQIFDRWGAMVFSKTGYDNVNDTFRGVGNSGNKLPEGTYYYVIERSNMSTASGFLLVRN